MYACFGRKEVCEGKMERVELSFIRFSIISPCKNCVNFIFNGSYFAWHFPKFHIFCPLVFTLLDVARKKMILLRQQN